jgi:hypothetical protein
MNKKYLTEEERKEAKRLYNKEYREKNKEKIKELQSNWLKNNPDYFKDLAKSEKEIKRKKEWVKNNLETNKQIKKEWVKNNPDKVKESKNKWLEKNPNYYNQYIKERSKTDFIFKLSNNIRCLIRNSIKRNGFDKNNTTKNILGCTIEEFKQYLESKFEPWMSWNNYGLYNGTEEYGWDIDHIIPSSLANTEEELLKLNHFSNLQPLCSKVNRDIKKNIS